MSESPNGLWSGLPSERAHDRPLTYVERETLKVLWRFRHQPPGLAWLLGRGAFMTLILLPFMLIPGGIVAFFVAAANNLGEGAGSEATFCGLATGAAVWLGLATGVVVRDLIEVGFGVASWRMLNRILLFSEIERRLHPRQRERTVAEDGR